MTVSFCLIPRSLQQVSWEHSGKDSGNVTIKYGDNRAEEMFAKNFR
ncbi:MAG: hypothetical protein JKY76_02320 [Proteobacteria bacterium]|nr:hypothetical protein [Pseudomonadota bacterium]